MGQLGALRTFSQDSPVVYVSMHTSQKNSEYVYLVSTFHNNAPNLYYFVYIFDARFGVWLFATEGRRTSHRLLMTIARQIVLGNPKKNYTLFLIFGVEVTERRVYKCAAHIIQPKNS